jgi:hypothetical protein
MVDSTIFQIVYLVWICVAGYVPTDANSLIGYLVSTAHCDNISADESWKGGGVKPGPNYIKLFLYFSVVPLFVDCTN